MRALSAGLLFAAFAAISTATPIRYTVAGTANFGLDPNGQFNFQRYTDQPFALNIYLDTATLDNEGIFYSSPNFVTNTLSLGNAAGSVNDLSLFGSIDLPVMIYEENFPFVLFEFSPSDSYELTNEIGPVPVDVTIDPHNRSGFSPYLTTFGSVQFTSVSEVTFQAQYTPEPGSILLMALGGLFLGAPFLRRRLTSWSWN